MALNFSPRPIFPAHMPEENRVPGGGGTQEDIHDVLPDDPFGMDISSTVTAITGWLEDLGVSDYGVYGGGDEVGVDKGRCSLYEELNLWLDTHMNIQPRVAWNMNDNTMFRVDNLGGFFMKEALEGSVNSGGGGWNEDDNTMMLSVNSLGGFVTKEVLEWSVDSVGGGSGGWNKDDNTIFRVGSLDDSVMEEALEGSVDIGGGIGYGCFSTENVGFGLGDGCIHENKNVRSHDSLGSTLDKFVSEDALGHFVDKDGVRHGCETMMDVMFSCGGIDVDGNKNKEAFGGISDEMDSGSPHIGDGFGEFVSEDALGHFVDKGGVHRGCDVMFSCGGIGVDGYKNKEAFGGIVDEREDGGSSHLGNRFGEFVSEDAVGHFVDKDGVHHGCETMTDVMLGCGGISVDGSKNKVAFGGIFDETDDGSPHMALSFALAYLDVRDLLSVERVCKSLRHTVQNDPLLWMNIQIGHPLNDRITDDDLLRLTNRAQGHLQRLNLVDCKVVTDEGLRRVLKNNPRMSKLGVPGCIKISTEGVMSCLKTYQLEAVTGIDCIRIAGHAVTLEQYIELHVLLCLNKHVQPHCPKPHIFNRENIYIPLEDDRPIDLELCPKCKKLKLIYTCTAERCQAADQTSPSCKACISCIPRCEQCGRCIFNLPHVETFCLGFVCTDCSPDSGSSSFMHVVSSEIDG